MSNAYNNQFMDAIDELNKMAYMLVNKNAKEWARQAAELELITYRDRTRIEQLVDLRNSMGHGNSRYINVGLDEVNEVKKYARIMSKNATQFKSSKTNQSRGVSNNHPSPKKSNNSSGYYPDNFYTGNTERDNNYTIDTAETNSYPFTTIHGSTKCKACRKTKSFCIEHMMEDVLIYCSFCGNSGWVPMEHLPPYLVRQLKKKL